MIAFKMGNVHILFRGERFFINSQGVGDRAPVYAVVIYRKKGEEELVWNFRRFKFDVFKGVVQKEHFLSYWGKL